MKQNRLVKETTRTADPARTGIDKPCSHLHETPHTVEIKTCVTIHMIDSMFKGDFLSLLYRELPQWQTPRIPYTPSKPRTDSKLYTNRKPINNSPV